MKLPFLYFVQTNAPGISRNRKGKNYWVVKIAASFDYVHYSSGWMGDDDLPEGQTLIPDVDICEEKHIFYSEKEAVSFIKDWWKKQG